MIRVAIDEAVLAAAGLSLTRDGNKAYFTWTPEEGEEEGESLASVWIEGGEFIFFPRRSASQREVLQILGIVV
jgi:hypothetical protein